MDIPHNIETTLYIVRHGETDFNRKQMVQGRGVDAPLNQTGVLQAGELSKRLKKLSIDVAYSSTLLRAKQTAKILIEEHKGISLTCISDLEEMSWGVYEGKSRSATLNAAFDDMKTAWSVGNYDFRIEGGETLLEVQERGVNALEHIVNTNLGKKILIVSHGRFIRILLATILDGFDLDAMRNLKQHNTAFNHVVFNNNRYHSRTLNCIRHLEHFQS